MHAQSGVSSQLLFGDVVMVRRYLIVGDIDPESQGLVHSDLHC
jgi:hypothetical protein